MPPLLSTNQDRRGHRDSVRNGRWLHEIADKLNSGRENGRASPIDAGDTRHKWGAVIRWDVDHDGFRVTVTPVRIPQTRTTPSCVESQTGLFCPNQSTLMIAD